LETTAELLAGFVDTYAPFELAGGVVLSGEVLLLGPTLSERIGVNLSAYIEAVTPSVGLILAAEASTRGALAAMWLDSAARELSWFVRRGRPGPKWNCPQLDNPQWGVAVDTAVRAARGALTGIRVEIPVDRSAAAAWLRAALKPEIDRLSTLVAPPSGRIGFFWGPAVLHRLSLGLYPCNPLVTVRTVGSIMDQRDLVACRRPEMASSWMTA
jgi:hypothetical protein